MTTAEVMTNEDGVGADSGADATQIQRGHGTHDQKSEHGKRNPRQQPLNGQRRDDGADQGDDQVIQEHGPAGQEAQVRVETAGDVGVSGSGHRVDQGHTTVADGRDHHGHHRHQYGGHRVAVRSLLEQSENGHRRYDLHDDHAVDE